MGEVPVNEIGDIDLVRACGMAGAGNPLGLAIWRWRYAGDTREVFRIAEALIAMGYGELVVYNVMHHLSKDVCPVCHGRGYDHAQDTGQSSLVDAGFHIVIAC